MCPSTDFYRALIAKVSHPGALESIEFGRGPGRATPHPLPPCLQPLEILSVCPDRDMCVLGSSWDRARQAHTGPYRATDRLARAPGSVAGRPPDARGGKGPRGRDLTLETPARALWRGPPHTSASHTRRLVASSPRGGPLGTGSGTRQPPVLTILFHSSIVPV